MDRILLTAGRMACLLLVLPFCALASGPMAVGTVAADNFTDAAHQEGKVTLSMKNAPLRAVLDAIEEQAGVRLMYDMSAVNEEEKVSITVRNATVEELLKQLFRDKALKWSKKGNVIRIRRAPVTKETEPEAAISQDTLGTVSGVVSDTSGMSLPGVSVMVKGTGNGTTTDLNGRYELPGVTGEEVLVFSFLGYKTQEVTVNGREAINIAMQVDIAGLDEVVVVGYGTVKKSDLTGSVSTITADDLEGRQTVQVSDALQGAVPGLTVTRNNGAPGASSSIVLRGITTIGNNSPLIIIDGVPGSTDLLNPSDIESITVLKDAASASIYGSRAAAGVILITTKRAAAGESLLEYNYEFGIQKPTRLPEYVNAVRYFQLFNEFITNDGATPLYSEEYIANYMDNHQQNPDLFPNTDWQDVILADYAPRHRHELTFSTGTEKIKTRASFAYANSDGLYNNRSFERYTARLNNTMAINQDLDINVDVSFIRRFYLSPSDESGNRNPFYFARNLPSFYKDRYQDGRWGLGKDGINPLAQVVDGGTDKNYYNEIRGRLALNFRPVEGLTLTAIAAPEFSFNRRKIFSKIIEYTDINDPSRVIDRNQPNTTLAEYRNEGRFLNGQLLANYRRTFNNQHHLELLAGYEENYYFDEYLDASRGAFSITTLPYLNIGSASLDDNAGSAEESALRSYFGRFQYNFENKYYIQGNIRRDGSSRFAPDHRWSLFPSLSVGWVLSEEDFLKTSGPISFLKVRGSYGKVGNERIGNYPYQSSIVFGSALFYSGEQVVSTPTGAQQTYAIPDISWEVTTSFDVGIDFNLFRNRLQTTVDYYTKRTEGILLNLDIPNYLGYEDPNVNAGVVGAKGWDMETNWTDRRGELTYSISFNISDSKTEIMDLKGTRILSSRTANIEGGEFNQWFGYRSLGLFQTEEEIQSSAVLNSNTKPGDVKYMDIDGDGRITSEGDKVLLDGSLPRLTYGGNLRLSYRNFDLGLAFQGVGKRTSVLSNVQVEPIIGGYGNVPEIVDGRYWSRFNTAEQNLAAKYPRLSQTSKSNNYQMSDFWMIDGSYFRLKNLTLGYSLSSSSLEKIKVKGLRIYLAANDALSFHKFPQGWDPEVEAATYPIVKTFMAGLNIQF